MGTTSQACSDTTRLLHELHTGGLTDLTVDALLTKEASWRDRLASIAEDRDKVTAIGLKTTLSDDATNLYAAIGAKTRFASRILHWRRYTYRTLDAVFWFLFVPLSAHAAGATSIANAWTAFFVGWAALSIASLAWVRGPVKPATLVACGVTLSRASRDVLAAQARKSGNLTHMDLLEWHDFLSRSVKTLTAAGTAVERRRDRVDEIEVFLSGDSALPK